MPPPHPFVRLFIFAMHRDMIKDDAEFTRYNRGPLFKECLLEGRLSAYIRIKLILQCDQIIIAVFFWYLGNTDLSSKQLIQGTKKTRSCCTGHPVFYYDVQNMYYWYTIQYISLFFNTTYSFPLYSLDTLSLFV